MSDRVVHADHPSGEEIVRYDRRGKWYIELTEASPDAGQRKQVLLMEAVQRSRELAEQGGTIHLGKPGGSQFDALVKR